MHSLIKSLALGAVLALAALPGIAHSQSLSGTLLIADGHRSAPGFLYAVSLPAKTIIPIGPIRNESGSVHYAITGMAFAPDGTLYAVSNGREGGADNDTGYLLIINPLTAVATEVGPLGADYNFIGDIAFVGEDLFGFTHSDGLLSIDLEDGEVTEIGGMNTLNGGGEGLAYSGTTLYHCADGDSGGGVIESIDTSDGDAIAEVDLDDDDNDRHVSGATFVGDTMVGVMNNFDGGTVDLATINPATGLITRIMAVPAGVDAVAAR